MYKIAYHKRTLKQLDKLPRFQKTKIVKKIHQLQNWPLSSNPNIKRFYKTKNSWRLRIGKLRIIFQTDKKKKLILIQNIGFRGNIYKK